MIVYLATYPRCGAALLRSTVRLNWRYKSANSHAEGHLPDRLKSKATDDAAVVTYQWSGAPERRMLVSPCESLMTHERRTRLGADPELFFVKTHSRPPDEPVPGEVAVQLVRHPGASLTSYWQLGQKTAAGAQPIADFIEGRCYAGRWDQYHDAWAAGRMPLLRRRFEDMLARPAKVIHDISVFLGLPMPENPRLLDSKAAHARNPIRNPIKGVDGWKSQITRDEQAHIWSVHGATARAMGYAEAGIAESTPSEAP